MQLEQGVDLKLTFEDEASQFAQRRPIRDPQKVVKYSKNKKVSRQNTKVEEFMGYLQQMKSCGIEKLRSAALR